MDPRYARNVPALSEAECNFFGAKVFWWLAAAVMGGHLIDMLARIGRLEALCGWWTGGALSPPI